MHTRSEFLTAGAVAALTPGLASAATPPATKSSPSPSPEPPLPPLQFDLAAFDKTLGVSAPHRHLFAAKKAAGGDVLSAMRNTLNAYADIGAASSDVMPVAVLYHGAVFIGFDDAMWNEYFIPLHAKGFHDLPEIAKDFETIYDAKKIGNPCLHKTGGKHDSSIEALVADAGSRFYVCNNAASAFARYIGGHLKRRPGDVYANLAAHLVPNAMLVPAGVWAVHAVQERKYTLLQASL